jgi:hypothetical protein
MIKLTDILNEGRVEKEVLQKISKFETLLGYITNDDQYKPLVSKVKREIDKLKKQIEKNESVNEGKEPEIITQLRDVVKNGYKTLKDPKSGKRMKVDTYSASAIVGVYDKLNPSNKEKFVKQGLLGMQSLAFKLIK